ncbi:hypothetical protein GCM10011316_17870 [Roseibium aquae]|uniref:Glucans biosynthesis glucosyltransferase H n=1 Tax=Roseibium aquae TaxID=1323746 RepID=A0A916TI94_9HYPH|nr:glucans biosynthesis glucosyltransferase MdoH [Roseibium aquae]GGB46195.1 hypothetical protein GCM10011316_17870 [Roseibium aquae]
MTDELMKSPATARPIRTKLRRAFFAGAVLSLFFGLSALMAFTLSPGGLGPLDLFILACFMVTLPWTIIGFLNAVIGLLIMRFAKDPVSAVCPIDPGSTSQPIPSSTAILSCIRDEDVDRLETNLSALLAELQQGGAVRKFALYVLSDSSSDEIALAEEEMVARLQAIWGNRLRIAYRRRQVNTGFKAGNIADFCDRWGAQHDYALVLDADSVMSAQTVLDMVRKMDANPRLGILQSLAVGLPTASAFARIFQFGMRLGMRSYTIGSAWWQGDCGPYWGHNAILRLAPFTTHCRLPELPGTGPLSGPILSHDQVEAVLMRRAGFECRVLPVEDGSYEENPPHLLEFIRRDLRWCQGNLQYRRLLTLPGLLPISRVQLALAMLMFLSSPAWLGFMIGAATLGYVTTGYAPFRADSGVILFFTVMTMVFAPKIATVADIVSRRRSRQSYGGAFRVVAGSATEILYSAMLAPIMSVAHSLFMGGLIFGRKIGWGAQARGVARLPLRLAASKLWPQTLFGATAAAWMSTQPLGLIWPIIPLAVGPLFAIPFAVATSTSIIGWAAYRTTLWRLPEEICPPSTLLALRLPILTAIGFSTPNPPSEGDPELTPVPVEV